MNKDFDGKSVMFLPDIDSRNKSRKKKTKSNGSKKRGDNCICGRPIAPPNFSCGVQIKCIVKMAMRRAKKAVKRHHKLMPPPPQFVPENFRYSMEELQQRNRVVKYMRKNIEDRSIHLVRPLNICTGIAHDGIQCISCQRNHKEPKQIWKTGNAAIDNFTAKQDAKHMRAVRRVTDHQFKLFARSARKLADRRRKREIKLDLPSNYLLRDYSLDGGGDVDREMAMVVQESLQTFDVLSKKKFDGNIGHFGQTYEGDE